LVANAPTAAKKVDVPDSLRDSRNTIHPGRALKNYRPEIEFEPDALAAFGLFSRFMTDVRNA
jgi:hypothetical protein